MKVKLINSSLEFDTYVPVNIADFTNPQYMDLPNNPDPTLSIVTTKESISIGRNEGNSSLTTLFIIKNAVAGKIYRFKFKPIVNGSVAAPGNGAYVIGYNNNNDVVLQQTYFTFSDGVETVTFTIPSGVTKPVFGLTIKWNENTVVADEIEIKEVVS